MKKRAWVIVGVVAAVVIGALAAVYLTGLVIVGDPFSGLWNTSGQPVGAKGGSGYLIKRADDGYVVTALAGTHVQGWRPLQRHGRTLDGSWYGEEMAFEYQPWSGHLVWKYWEHGKQLGPGMTLKRATSSTSIPAQTN